MKPMNVEYLMMDASILLPPTGTPLTGIDFVKRLPCGDVEKTRRVSKRRRDPPLLGCHLTWSRACLPTPFGTGGGRHHPALAPRHREELPKASCPWLKQD